MDIVMMAIGLVAAAGLGAITPLMIIVFTNMIDDFSSTGKAICSVG
jgi:hypothetical protein